MRLSGGKRIIIENQAKEKHLTTKQALVRREGKLLCKKGVTLKAGIPPFISKETVRRVLRKTDQPEIDSFSEERNPDPK